MGRFHDRMDEDLRIRGYSANTRASYLRCVRHFVRCAHGSDAERPIRGAYVKFSSPLQGRRHARHRS